MSPDVQIIKRTLAAVPGSDLPRDVVRFLEDGFTRLLHSPGITMDDAFGLRGPIGKRRAWSEYGQQKRAELLQRHKAKYHEAQSKKTASKIIAGGLERRAKGDDQVPPEIIELYDALVQLPVALPRSPRQVEKYLSIPLKDPL